PRRQEELRAELAGPGASPLVRLLARRAALTGLQADYLDALAAQSPGLGQAAGERLQRLADRAQRRHLLAVKALALVCKLLPPAPGGKAAPARPPHRRVGLHRRAAGSS